MKIVAKKILVHSQDTRIIQLTINAPMIAKKALAGQYVMIMAVAQGERIPLTVVDNDDEQITLIFQEIGFSTRLLGRLAVGESVYALVGPLGQPSHISCDEKVVLVGGGVGVAELLPVAKALSQKGNELTVIMGARNKQLLILEDKLREISSQVLVSTDDGSAGRKGYTTDILNELLQEQSTEGRWQKVYCVGPLVMMERVSHITRAAQIPTIVSLNALMVDATGMCGVCRVTVGGTVKFTCIDGPEFDGHLLDWQELKARSVLYQQQEKHICKLGR